MKPKFDLSFLVKIQSFILVIFICFLCIHSFILKKELDLSKRERNGYRRFFDAHQRNVSAVTTPLSKIILPTQLQNIPFGEIDNIVLRTKKIHIRNVVGPYNPSLLKQGEGYLLFFRYDTTYKSAFSSYIGCVELDKNFEQTEKEFIPIDTSNHHSEDPRVFQAGGKTYLTYSKTDFSSHYDFSPATIHIANIDLKNYKVQFATELELNFHPVEKNWTPFEYVNAEGHSQILLQYSLNPHKILHLPKPEINHLIHPAFPRDDVFQRIHWENKITGWGTLRGGTPALKVDDKYLGFFHSSFSDKGQVWYIMGAYTFENSPPFRLTSMSRYPIFFLGMYDSVPLNVADATKRVIFPAGFVVEKQGDQELIHVSCGENDSAIKIITMDKKTLLKHMRKI